MEILKIKQLSTKTIRMKNGIGLAVQAVSPQLGCGSSAAFLFSILVITYTLTVMVLLCYMT